MFDHCEHKFTVYELAPLMGGGLYPAQVIDEKVHYCPFCGCCLDRPVPPTPSAVEPISLAPKRSKGKHGLN